MRPPVAEWMSRPPRFNVSRGETLGYCHVVGERKRCRFLIRRGTVQGEDASWTVGTLGITEDSKANELPSGIGECCGEWKCAFSG